MVRAGRQTGVSTGEMAVRRSQRDTWALWRPFYVVEREREPGCDPQGLVPVPCARPFLGTDTLGATIPGEVLLALLTQARCIRQGMLVSVALLTEFSP